MYQLTITDGIIKRTRTAYNTVNGELVPFTEVVFIPMEPLNKDYREYLAWLDLGNTPDPAE